jgi:hypothetical protein
MAAPITPNVKLRDIILMYSEAAIKSDSTFLRLWRTAFRGFAQMGLNHFFNVKTISIPVNENITATLPDDYINYIRIGNFNDKGELQVLSVNNTLTTFKDTNPNRLGDIATEVGSPSFSVVGNDYLPVSQNTLEGYYNTDNFGIGSRLLTVGECKLDIANRVILLNTSFPYPHIILEYIPSPEQDDDYEIPIQFQEAMIAWLGWQDIQYAPLNNRNNPSVKKDMANNFKNQLLLARKSYKPIRLQDIALQFREAQRYVVKG